MLNLSVSLIDFGLSNSPIKMLFLRCETPVSCTERYEPFSGQHRQV